MSKKLVAYFSASGVTGKVAKDLAEAKAGNSYGGRAFEWKADEGIA